MPWQRVTVRRIHWKKKQKIACCDGYKEGVSYLRQNGGEERKEEAVIAGAACTSSLCPGEMAALLRWSPGLVFVFV